MNQVSLGHHMAVVAARSDQDRIRRFYCGILGCRAQVATDQVDRLVMGDTHFCFVYQSAALPGADFLRSTYLELAAEDPQDLTRRILAFGVERLEVPDPHLYFQAPGGQVFRVVGRDEDLSPYEDSASTRPVSGTSVAANGTAASAG